MNMRINPLWLFWLVIGTFFQVIGGVFISNQLKISFIPLIIILINCIFIIYCYVPIKNNKKGIIK